MDTPEHRNCFVNAHCSSDCPNFDVDMVNDRYGYGIADDMGLAVVKCKDCIYNSETCDNCLFQCSKDCPSSFS